MKAFDHDMIGTRGFETLAIENHARPWVLAIGAEVLERCDTDMEFGKLSNWVRYSLRVSGKQTNRQIHVGITASSSWKYSDQVLRMPKNSCEDLVDKSLMAMFHHRAPLPANGSCRFAHIQKMTTPDEDGLRLVRNRFADAMII